MTRSFVLCSILVAGVCLPQTAHAWRFWGKEYTHIGLDDYNRPIPCYDVYRFGVRTGSGCGEKNPNSSGEIGTASAIAEMSSASGAVLVETDNTNFMARRKYNLEKDDKTGWWRWSCKDGSGSGTSASKKGARKDGASNCSGAFDLEPIVLREAILHFERDARQIVEVSP